MPTVKSNNGVYINVYDPNPKGKETIVFIHGWPLNHKMFEYQLNALPEYRCVAVDLRGFGLSGAAVCNYFYEAFADDIAAVVQQLGLRNFTLAGFSMGGAVALKYMSRHKGTGVKKLILLSAAAPVFTKRPGFPYGISRDDVDQLITLGLQNRPLMLEQFNDMFLLSGTDAPFRNWCNMLGLEASAVGTMQSLYTLRDSDLRPDTKSVKVPTGVFHGKLDRVCPYALGVKLHEMIPGSKLFSFANSGHCIFHDELDQFNYYFKRFICE